jgi:alanine racemase
MSVVEKKSTNEAAMAQATWAEVSLSALAANYRRLQSAAAGAEVMGVVKADGYGHGAAQCALALAQANEIPAQWLGVTDAAEGAAVRRAVKDPAVRILLMRGLLAGEIESAMEAALTPVVWTVAQMDALEAAAVRLDIKEFAVHMEIDTGMSRQGVSPAELPAMLARFTQSSPLRLEGVMTHFAAAEEVASPQNDSQMKIFEQALEQIRAAGLRPEWIHAGSTSTVDAGSALPVLLRLAERSKTRLMCRAGIGLYGYALPLTGAASQVHGELEPVLAWKTRILSISDTAPGARVGYNGTFIAEKPMRLALLPVGYADGLRRELSNAGEVLITGKRARIVGRVSMDVTIVDVTAVPGAKAGDEVVILGTQGGERITADDHARIAGTIAYEILCGINVRVPRCYLSGDEQS